MNTEFRYIACRECDLLHRRVPLPPDGIAHCTRCRAVLYSHRRDRSEQTLAWAVAGLILFAIANLFPVLRIEVQGQASQVTLISSVLELFREHRPMVATVVLFTGLIAPLVRLSGTLYVLLPLKLGRAPGHLREILRLMDAVRPWDMVSIFLLGSLVSLTKLASMADVIIGIGLWSMVGLIVTLAAVDATFDPEPIWQRIRPVHT